MKYFSITFLFLWVSFPGMASNYGSTVKVDDSNFKEIYNSNKSYFENHERNHSKNAKLRIVFSYQNLDTLNLSNKYFSADYSTSFKSIPALKIESDLLLWKVNSKLNLDLTFSGAIGYREAKTELRSSLGTSLQDNVSVFWIPLTAGIQVKYYLDNSGDHSLFFTPHVGVQYLYQSGNLDGINQGYWIPSVNAKLGVTLFEISLDNALPGFQGIVLSGNYTTGKVDSNQISGISADIGLQMSL